MNVEKEQELRDLYYDPVNGYRSREKLYQKALEKGLKISRRKVKEWLETQDTYTRFKPIVRKHKFQKTYVKELAGQIQLDLVDMGKYKHKNNGYYCILTGVEVLSRYAFAIPVQRKDTTHMTEAVEKLLQEFKIGYDKYPNVVQFDNGKEFYNVGVKTLRENKGIKYFSTHSDKKVAIVESFNKTLKTMMWKYFYSKGTYNWVGVLDHLVDNCNNTKHRSILMEPADVNKTNEYQVWKTLFGDAVGKFPLPKFRIGDTVRVSRYKSIFSKGYEANFTEEIFKVKKVLRGDPNMYEIEEATKGTEAPEPIIGKFYEEEHSRVNAK